MHAKDSSGNFFDSQSIDLCVMVLRLLPHIRCMFFIMRARRMRSGVFHYDYESVK